jgi:putative Mg2+ transporter-C (MgtC) family protein
MNSIVSLWMLADLGLAMTLGGIIGIERELKDRPAGFRTHTLVAGSAALLVCIGQLVLIDERFSRMSNVVADPLRLVEAVVAGVAFIGAGTIFANRHQGTVSGITTAASLLIVAVVGVAIAFRYYALGLGAAALTLIVLSTLERIERKLAASAKKSSDVDGDGDRPTHNPDVQDPRRS